MNPYLIIVLLLLELIYSTKLFSDKFSKIIKSNISPPLSSPIRSSPGSTPSIKKRKLLNSTESGKSSSKGASLSDSAINTSSSDSTSISSVSSASSLKAPKALVGASPIFKNRKVKKNISCSDAKTNVCGLLAIDTGYSDLSSINFKPEYYHPDQPRVHGLWPQTLPYGTSDCKSPEIDDDPTFLFSCYDLPQTSTTMSALDFEIYEWNAHGKCSGTKNAIDYFTQVCDLSYGPLSKIQDFINFNWHDMKTKGLFYTGTLADAELALIAAGYEVYYTNIKNGQLSLTVCLRSDGIWIFSKVADFAINCT